MTQDILIDDEADLRIENGDFVLGESDQQHVVLLINTFAGHWKQFPTCGVGIIQYLASSNQGAALRRSINVQLTADGYRDITVDLRENPSGFFDYDVSANRP